jgi:alkanesulfonate monooxygenase SsuD/methylene tetrahydromethanopterin reductase-like flavin-dependent oxidoreductase (luciferase family)
MYAHAEPMPHPPVYLLAGLGAAMSYLLAATGDHLIAVVVAVIAATPSVLTWRETRKNRAEIRRRRTIVTRGDTQVVITDEDLEELERKDAHGS